MRARQEHREGVVAAFGDFDIEPQAANAFDGQSSHLRVVFDDQDRLAAPG